MICLLGSRILPHPTPTDLIQLPQAKLAKNGCTHVQGLSQVVVAVRKKSTVSRKPVHQDAD